ncbi:MAG: helix-turn-helix domain-containing protein [Actinomycetota bacterium]|nr:helix-turn-helix domain-containing protein [Actinomycetota bacterium]
MPDPADGPKTENLIDAIELAKRVRAKRRSKKLSIREAAEVVGVSAPTISRVERGHVPERETLLRLARWAGVRIDPVLHENARRVRTIVVHGPDASTLEAVELHLRADKNLSRDDAEALSEMFRLAYDALSAKQARSKGKGK